MQRTALCAAADADAAGEAHSVVMATSSTAWARVLAGSVIVLAISACGRSAEPVVKPAEASGMWSGVLATRRKGVAPFVPAGQPSQHWPTELSDEERERCRQAAWNAVMSPETWSRYFESPESAAGLTGLTQNGIRYVVDRRDAGIVEVEIPSGASVGWHPTFIAVKLARGSYEVVDMDSSFWP